jgi:signal transduction histidine kinase
MLCSGLVALAALGVPTIADASCKTPLPTPEYRALDASVERNAVAATEAARAALARTPATDRLARAELAAIIADAADWTGDDGEARRAIAIGRDALAGLTRSVETEHLQLRLALVDADAAEGNEVLSREAVAALDWWERRLPPDSLPMACLTLARARIEWREGNFALATRHALTAHDLAVRLHEPEARTEAAVQLSSIYEATGLYDEAQALTAEVIAATRPRGLDVPLSYALYEQARTLRQAGRPAEAIGVAREARAISVAQRDAINVAFSDLELCADLLGTESLDDATAACRAAVGGFEAAGREDQVRTVIGWQARIAVRRGRLDEGIALFAKTLADDGAHVSPKTAVLFYPDYAAVLAARGQVREALHALQRYLALSSADEVRRRMAVAEVVRANEQYREAERGTLALDARLAAEQAQFASQRTISHLWTGLAAALAVLAAGLGYLLVVSRRLADAVRRQEAILRATAENSPDALSLLAQDGTLRFANRDLFGGSRPPSVGARLEDSAPDAMRDVVARALRELLQKRRPLILDVEVVGPEGPRQLELRGVPIVVGGALIGATVRSTDVTERRRLEASVIEIAGRERHRLSGELHEGLGQELAGIALSLRSLATGASRGAPVEAADLQDAITAIERSIATTRDLARDLSPVRTERGSLSVALARLAADASRRFGVPVTAASDPEDVALADEASDQFYRIAREAIANAVSHGRATRVAVSLARRDGSLTLEVADDGVGMDAPAPAAEGLRLRMMRYRADLMHGTFEIQSVPGQGTRVRVVVPDRA